MSVKVQEVSKIYGKQKALDNLSFEINQGEIVGFLGPNGAGKSTMMKIITGYIPQTSGLVEVNGLDVSMDSLEIKRQIGYLPEHNPLYLEMYVKEYLGHVASIYKLGKSKARRIAEMIDLTGLGTEQNKKIASLSKGYRQRVGIAQALIHDPKVLILDEPTTGLDPNQLLEIRKLIIDIGREKTVMLSTHIMQEVEACCQRVLIVNKGKLVADRNIDFLASAKSSHVVEVEFASEVSSDLLQEISGVNEIEVLGENRYCFVSLRDIRKDVFQFAVSKSLVILEMKTRSENLEDIFHELTL
ncbi:gliding motility-associated ABC transporter ATP-binding subunit GldA [Labilibaculum euxinus]|uniref:Gliding motility-associated ABC transporter ATP-binding subunit GldA n=1 Tax=Labilibaculum euxinus TaxID=2686357 RepID=A0A7M4DBR3_9BACT|nr:gliding motility-associated ABC transporter ATP-binding subunit GldA [Labilibaculum euxinus]MUP40092.1 gliding motility-associated ABC transporter ATP-binding subunit GldA [Labilibaculum euxinus]MVB09297.1 gliding motility-associated ABC transporter ATP-binding subunit GldA [Labilibaculum euxinus]